MCHGARTREDRGTRRRGWNSNKQSLMTPNKARQGRTRQDRHRREHQGVTSRPDQIKLNRQDYKYTGLGLSR